MKTLQIIHTAYRATIEEQDDTIVWLTHAMAGAGGEFDVLLCGNAANYVARAQDAEGIAFGEWRQTQPPRIARDIEALVAKGVNVYVVADDAAECGLSDADQIEGARLVARKELAELVGGYDRVWRW